MPVRYTIDAAVGLVRITLDGAVTTAEVLAHYAELAVDPGLRPGLSVLIRRGRGSAVARRGPDPPPDCGAAVPQLWHRRHHPAR